MDNEQQPATAGEIVTGSLFSELMRVVTVTSVDFDTLELGLLGVETQAFRSVPLSLAEVQTLKVDNATRSYAGNATSSGSASRHTRSVSPTSSTLLGRFDLTRRSAATDRARFQNQ